MTVDERSRHRLFNRLEEVLGPEEASTLMAHLPPAGWADVATKQDLTQLEARLETKVDATIARLESRIMWRILVANSASIITVGGLAFAAARLV